MVFLQIEHDDERSGELKKLDDSAIDVIEGEALAKFAQWVSAIGNHVKNPIAGISAALAVIEKQIAAARHGVPCDADVMETAIALSRRRLAKLNSYATELMEYTRPITLKKVSVDLSDLVICAVDRVRSETGFSGQVSQLFAGDSRLVEVDSDRLESALSAVLANAFEAVPVEREPMIEVAVARRWHRGQSFVEVSVSDNGPGLPPEQVERCLQPFVSSKEASTGLGLAIAEKYVEAHGGEVHVGRSPALGGARISLLIPAYY